LFSVFTAHECRNRQVKITHTGVYLPVVVDAMIGVAVPVSTAARASMTSTDTTVSVRPALSAQTANIGSTRVTQTRV